MKDNSQRKLTSEDWQRIVDFIKFSKLPKDDVRDIVLRHFANQKNKESDDNG